MITDEQLAMPSSNNMRVFEAGNGTVCQLTYLKVLGLGGVVRHAERHQPSEAQTLAVLMDMARERERLVRVHPKFGLLPARVDLHKHSERVPFLRSHRRIQLVGQLHCSAPFIAAAAGVCKGIAGEQPSTSIKQNLLTVRALT